MADKRDVKDWKETSQIAMEDHGTVMNLNRRDDAMNEAHTCHTLYAWRAFSPRAPAMGLQPCVRAVAPPDSAESRSLRIRTLT